MKPGLKRSLELNRGAPDGWTPRNCSMVPSVYRDDDDTPPHLFAIISTWFDADIIEATVANCFAQGCERVYLLDNASPDDTVERAKKAGAVLAKSYKTEYYDEDLRIRLQNDIVRRVTEATKAPDLWWFVLDADEFPGTPDGRPVREALRGLDHSFRTVGCDCIDLYPLSDDQYVPGTHPAECMTHGAWRRGGVRVWCQCSHWKHCTIRYLDGVYDFAHTRGNHTFAVPPGSKLALHEPNCDLTFFHAPIRRKEDAYRRLEALCGSGRSKWDDEAINSNGAIKRWRCLDAVYSQRWSEVEVPHSQVYGRDLKGIALYPWRKLLARPSEASPSASATPTCSA